MLNFIFVVCCMYKNYRMVKLSKIIYILNRKVLVCKSKYDKNVVVLFIEYGEYLFL